jgi:hypothetical protein
MIFYHGGSYGRSEMMKLSYAGSSYVIGNLGVNVTPSAWGLGSGGSALQISGGALSSYTNSNLTVAQNTYFNGSDWKYTNTAGATIYQQVGSVHAWSTAPSGTAGTTTTLTERMRIDSSGNVFVGGTTRNGATGPVYSRTTAKVWATVIGSATPTIGSSFGISSITSATSSSFTLNFTTAFADANYCVTTGVSDGAAYNWLFVRSPTTTSVGFASRIPSGDSNFTTAYMAVFA